MNLRTMLVGLCAACSLIFCGVAAPAAMANKEDTTAFTCSASAATKSFGDADCSESGSSFGHTAIPANTETQLKVGGGTTVLKFVAAGANVVLTAASVEPVPGSFNWMENKENGAEMWVAGEGRLTFKGVTENHGCKVEGLTAPGGEEMLSTTQLKTTTKGASLPAGVPAAQRRMAMEFVPAVKPGEPLLVTEFNLVNAACPAALKGLNPFKVIGSVTGEPKGANVVFTQAITKEEGTLRVLGNVAGINGSLTLSGREEVSTGPFTALSFTTE
jgi:hypothetical protein